MPSTRGLRSYAGGAPKLHVGKMDDTQPTCQVLAFGLNNFDNSTRILSKRVVRLPSTSVLNSGALVKSPLTHSQSCWVQVAAMERWIWKTIQKSVNPDPAGKTWNSCHQYPSLPLYATDGNPYHDPGVDSKFYLRAASRRGRKEGANGGRGISGIYRCTS